MSAYIVKDATINRVVTFLWSDDNARYTKKRLAEEVHAHSPAHLGQAMFNLNVVAINARYGPGEAEKFRTLDYRYGPEVPHEAKKIYQVLKSLKCWLYQCSEGEVPQTPLYQIMDEYASRMAFEIVYRLPAYEAAPRD